MPDLAANAAPASAAASLPCAALASDFAVQAAVVARTLDDTLVHVEPGASVRDHFPGAIGSPVVAVAAPLPPRASVPGSVELFDRALPGN